METILRQGRLLLLAFSLLALGGWLAPKVSAFHYQLQAVELLQGVENQLIVGKEIRPAIWDLDPIYEEDSRMKVQMAITNLEKSLVANPNAARSGLLMGRAYLLLGSPIPASEHYKNYIQMRPGDPLGYLELGFVYEDLCAGEDDRNLEGDFGIPGVPHCSDPKFATMIKESWETAGASAADFFDRAEQERRREEYQGAIAWYNRAAMLDNTWYAPWSKAGLIYLRIGDIKNASQALRTATQLAPERRDTWYNLGDVYERLGLWESALEAYNHGLLADTGQVGESNILYKIGRILQTHRDPPDTDSALVAFRAALDRMDYPIDQWQVAATHYSIGILLINNGQRQEAFIELQNALRANPDHYWAGLSLARLLMDNNKIAEAKELSLDLISLAPYQTQAYKLLGDIYLREGNLEAAEETFMSVLKIDPNDQDASTALRMLAIEEPTPPIEY